MRPCCNGSGDKAINDKYCSASNHRQTVGYYAGENLCTVLFEDKRCLASINVSLVTMLCYAMIPRVEVKGGEDIIRVNDSLKQISIYKLSLKYNMPQI